MSKKKGAELIEYLKSGYVAYGVKFGKDGEPNRLTAVPKQGMETQEELVAFLRETDIEFYVQRMDEDNDYDSVGNDLDGCAVDLEVLEWLEHFQVDGSNHLCTPMTLAYIPSVDIELGAGSSPEEVMILGELAVFVAEFRLVKGLEPGESLDEAIM